MRNNKAGCMWVVILLCLCYAFCGCGTIKMVSYKLPKDMHKCPKAQSGWRWNVFGKDIR